MDLWLTLLLSFTVNLVILLSILLYHRYPFVYFFSAFFYSILFINVLRFMFSLSLYYWGWHSDWDQQNQYALVGWHSDWDHKNHSFYLPLVQQPATSCYT